ncbi:exodeoxyribonuclease [Caudoviricetes sp.]|nr:exodeoxyribonuclease [Caudoviricetes sp.]
MALSDSTPETRFRNTVMPTYKQSRKTTRRPLVYKPLREWVHETFETFERPGLEGDDVLGILATRKDETERIVVSIDKDLKTIPGKLYNYGKPELGIIEVSEDQANYYHLLQTLTGDSTDGYPGCPGIGPVSAKKLLDPFWVTAEGETWFDAERAWFAVEKAYRGAKLGEDVALMNARVARILRAEDFDFKLHKPILWQP